MNIDVKICSNFHVRVVRRYRTFYRIILSRLWKLRIICVLVLRCTILFVYKNCIIRTYALYAHTHPNDNQPRRVPAAVPTGPPWLLLFSSIRQRPLFPVFYIFALRATASRIRRIESTGWIMLLNATLLLASNSHDEVLFSFRIEPCPFAAPRHFLLALYTGEYYVE